MKRIEYFYAAYSGYAYIGSALFQEIAAKAGAVVVHRPFFLRDLVAARGNAERVRETTYSSYWFGREIGRWAEYRGVPTIKRRPTYHHESYDMANRMLIARGETVPIRRKPSTGASSALPPMSSMAIRSMVRTGWSWSPGLLKSPLRMTGPCQPRPVQAEASCR